MPNGRPMQARSLEIKAALEGKTTGDVVHFDLTPEEQEKFYQFSQRSRTVAKSLGFRVSVRTDRNDKTKGIVEVLEVGVDPNAPSPNRGRRGRPRKNAVDTTESQANLAVQESEFAEGGGASRPGRGLGRPRTSEIVGEEAATMPVAGAEETSEYRASGSKSIPKAASKPQDATSVEATSKETTGGALGGEAKTAPCVVVGVTGSVSAYKAVEVVRGLQKKGCDVAVAMTPAAEKFIGTATFSSITDLPVAIDLFDWSVSQLPHIDLAEWADLICVVPASADAIAKLAHGFADDCVSATVLAASSKVVVCPAMNRHMWQNPATQANIRTLMDRGIMVVYPTEGYLVCGDFGKGKLAPVEDIVRDCLEELQKN